ncbi:hypothetical protein K492DRAFT_139248 [Lichtheimia hyalospora FSU 10163]|nr:hypothetical protein K492DRAFT_139248 [Lichtheimia hyalospora FSU 10163]
MKVNINKDETHGLHYIYNFNKSEHLMLEYDIYFSKNYDFAKDGKLPGLYGGNDKCSGGRNTSKCFSARLMWRKNGIGEIYAYLPLQKIKKNEIYHKNYGISLSRGNFKFICDSWINIKQEIKLNEINKNNGILKLWINNHLVIYYNDIIFRKYKYIYIDGIMMQIFYGGCNGDCSPNRNGYIELSNLKTYNL